MFRLDAYLEEQELENNKVSKQKQTTQNHANYANFSNQKSPCWMAQWNQMKDIQSRTRNYKFQIRGRS